MRGGAKRSKSKKRSRKVSKKKYLDRMSDSSSLETSQQNNDSSSTTIKKKQKTNTNKKTTKKKTKKMQLIDDVNAIASKYDYKLTLRQIYYRLVATEKLENNINNYKYLSRVLVDARKQGLVKHNIIEDRTRNTNIRTDSALTKEKYFDLSYEIFIDALENYKLPRWYMQEKRVIVVLEKQALENVFKDITNELEVSLVVARGYNSYTQIHEIAEQIKSHDERYKERETIILQFGDMDPSGRDIIANFQRQLAEEGINAEYKTIALTEEQITKYNLPPAPTKKSDSRTKKFIEKHGDMAVELDAIEPEILQKMIRTNINKYFDEEVYRESLKIERKHKKYFKKKLEEKINETNGEERKEEK